jgi:hypothetical protein
MVRYFVFPLYCSNKNLWLRLFYDTESLRRHFFSLKYDLLGLIAVITISCWRCMAELERLIIVQLFQKSSQFYRNRRIITVFTKGYFPLDPVLSWMQSTSPNPTPLKILFNIVTILGYDYRRSTDLWMDLLTSYTHHSELQVITALSLISTLYKSPQQPPSLYPALCLHQPFLSNSFWQWRLFSFPRSGSIFTASSA